MKRDGCKGLCPKLYPTARKGIRVKYFDGMKKCIACEINLYTIDTMCQCCKFKFRTKSHCQLKNVKENRRKRI